MKKFLSVCLVMVLLLAQIPLTAVQAAETTAEYSTTLSATSGTRGNDVTVTVTLTLPTETKVNGIELTMEFDSKYFNYVAGSGHTGFSSLTDPTIHYNGSGKVEFVWTSDKGVTLPKEISLFVMTLKVSETSPAASTQIFTSMERLYQSDLVEGKVQMSAIPCVNNTLPTYTVYAADEQVANVISLINKIGQVSNDGATLERIANAGNAYSKLTASQKEQVTNYQVLLAAEELYNKMQANGVVPADVQALIDGFMTTHAEVLNLTIDQITSTTDPLSISQKIEAALADYETITSPYARAELVGEKTMLKRFLALLEDVAADLLDQQQQEAYQKEAAERYERFLNDNAYTLSLTPETVRTFDEGNVNDTWLSYEATCDMKGVGDYFKQLAVEEAALLEALKKQITDLQIEENPELSQEILNAQAYREQFAGILILTPEDLVYDDLLDVSLAYMLLEMLDDATQALLTEEKAIVTELYEAVLLLEPDTDTGIGGGNDDDDDDVAEPISAAELLAEQFKEIFGDLMTLTPQLMSYSDVLDVKLAKTMLDNLDGETLALLSAEQSKISTLYNRALALEEEHAAANPDVDEDTQAAQQWIDRFTRVLNMDADNLTEDDVLDIQLAKMALEMLSEEALALLTEEQAMIQTLYNKAITIEPEKEIITQVVEKLVNKKVRVEVTDRNTSVVVWILLAVAILAVAAYIIVSSRYRGKFLKGDNHEK